MEVGLLFNGVLFSSFVCDALDGWFARKFNQGKRFPCFMFDQYYFF